MAKDRECPNCPSIWDFNEIEDQQCSSCGYPHHQEDVWEDDDYICEEDIDYENDEIVENEYYRNIEAK